ncbi:transposase [Palleronia aestuarii]|uniref:Transposase n=1 Tax=Palleronia aestuarii TaxID=568105 RepID=A0A2W7MUB9_9RHOB|nr:IS630 transposase-related protein [Palleronia aestuarii]PZX11430.1 transposase [Palleronia aestuarii]
MGKLYSMDLRERVLKYIAAGNSCRPAAQVFRVSASTVVRLAADHRDSGVIMPKRLGRAPGTAGKLTPHTVFLAEIVRAEPDITLKELASPIGLGSMAPRKATAGGGAWRVGQTLLDPSGANPRRVLI